MNIYAFDVDETLEVSKGPVPMSFLRELHDAGHVVGLCGNYAGVTTNIPDWSRFISFIGQMAMSKAEFLNQLKFYVPHERRFMIGNDPALFGGSNDIQAAREAGWTFVREKAYEALRETM